jgi:hypothetical protein
MRSGLQFHTGKTGPKARNQQARNSSRQDLRSGLCKTQRILGPFDADSMVRRPDMESSFPKKRRVFFLISAIAIFQLLKIAIPIHLIRNLPL